MWLRVSQPVDIEVTYKATADNVSNVSAHVGPLRSHVSIDLLDRITALQTQVSRSSAAQP